MVISTAHLEPIPQVCQNVATAYPGIEFRLAYESDEAGLNAAASIKARYLTCGWTKNPMVMVTPGTTRSGLTWVNAAWT
jgi:hypothetical protein